MNSAPDYLFVGGLRTDTLITHDGRIYRHQIGGNAAYSAIGARIWGASTGLCARVGENYPSEWFYAFTAAGLDTAGIHWVPGIHDMRTFFAYLTPEVRDDRNPAAHFARLNQPLPPELSDYDTSTTGYDDLTRWAPLAVHPDDVPAAYFRARAAHIAPSHLLTQAQLPPALYEKGIPLVTLDPSERLMVPTQRATLTEILRQIHVFMPSEMEVRSLLPDLDLWEAANWFADYGPSTVVIKIGARGQLLYDRASGRRWEIPAYPTPVIDVTGAGDSFCGGFVTGFSETGDPLEAALRGSVSASLVIGGVGALYASEAPPHEAQRRRTELRTQVKLT